MNHADRKIVFFFSVRYDYSHIDVLLQDDGANRVGQVGMSHGTCPVDYNHIAVGIYSHGLCVYINLLRKIFTSTVLYKYL